MEKKRIDRSTVIASVDFGEHSSNGSYKCPLWEGTEESYAELDDTLQKFDLNKLKMLIKNGAPYLHETQPPFQYAIDSCAFYSRADIMELILERDKKERAGHSPEMRTTFECQTRAALSRVCKSNYLPIARMLLEAGTRVVESVHPHEAAKCGSWVVLNELYLHSKQPNLDPRDDDGYTPLHLAAKLGYIHTVRFLLKKGANIREKTEYEGLTPLHLACGTAGEDTIHLLVSQGADVNATDFKGRTPVFLAAENGKDSVISVLASAGANLDALDNAGSIPLIIACTKGHSVTVSELILNGASMEVTDCERYNGLERAIQNRMDAAAAIYIRLHPNKEFLEYYIDCMEINPIQIVKYGMLETIKALLDRMIVPDDSSRTSNGRVYVQYLDLDVDQKLPDSEEYSKSKNFLLQRISEIGDESLAYHGTVRLLVDEKMKKFGYLILSLRTFFFMCFLGCLGYSLVQAAAEREPLDSYFRDGFNIARLVCELFVLLYFLINLVTEAGEIIRIFVIAYNHIHDKQKQQQQEVERKQTVGATEEEEDDITTHGCLYKFYKRSVLIRVIYDYFRDKSNYFDVLGLLTITILIILRVTRQPTQWVFATFAFFFNSLRFFKLLALVPVLGPYASIIYKILIQDLPRFVMMLLITLCIFSCTFFISLRVPFTSEGFTNSSLLQLSTREPGVDDEVWWVFLSGIRVVLDGDVYQDSNFLYSRLNWLAVTIYIAFFFLTVVVYLNVFIAQLSDTYANVKLNAKRSFAWHRLNYIIQIQKSSMLSLCVDFRRHFFTQSVYVAKRECHYYYNSSTLNTYLQNQQIGDIDLKFLLSSFQEQQRVKRKVEGLKDPFTGSEDDQPSVPTSHKPSSVDERLRSLENLIQQLSNKMDRIR